MKMSRKLFSVLASITILGFAISAIASDLRPDPSRFKDSFRLSDYAGKLTFLQLMDTKVKPALDEIYGKLGRINNDTAIRKGQGVAVELHPGYWNFHVNYADGANKNPKVKDEMTGRSYGMGPDGEASDPSDAFYLDELEKALKGADERELSGFYSTLLEIIGNCDSRGFDSLRSPLTQAVATDFMAVYGAEEDRHLMGNLGSFNWDDALWEVTMLAALHSGQKRFTKFYEGEFKDQTYDQSLKSYQQPGKRTSSTPTRPAKLRDYWQFGRSVNDRGEQNRSGINVTRRDFERLGQSITEFEKGSAGSGLIQSIENTVRGGGKNVFKDITTFYINRSALNDLDAQGRSQTRDATDRLARDVAKLMVQIRADADAITASIRKTNSR
jgi:hypothetical protein